jgi:hypothetical protein
MRCSDWMVCSATADLSGTTRCYTPEDILHLVLSLEIRFSVKRPPKNEAEQSVDEQEGLNSFDTVSNLLGY